MNLPRTTAEQWHVLATVIDQGGFAQAARAMHKSQSAVSYAVQQLQQALGVPLLETQGRRAVLTEHGRTLLTRARGLLRGFDTLEQLASSLQRGWEAELSLVVDAAFPRERLLNIVAQLQSSCPATQIQLADAVLSGAEDALLEQRADIVVTSQVPAGFLGERLLDVEFVIAARPDHGLFDLGREITAADLEQHVQAVVRDSGTRRPRDDGWLGSPRRFTVSSMEASLATLLAGLAYAWLPLHLISPQLASGALKRLPLHSGAVRHVALYLVMARPETAGPAAHAAVLGFKR